MPANSKSKPPEFRIFTIREKSSTFVTYFDQTQEQLETLASMDDLLSGIQYAVYIHAHCLYIHFILT